MSPRIIFRTILLFVLLLIPLLISADEQMTTDTYMSDPAGNSISDSGFSGIAPTVQSSTEPSAFGAVFPASNLTRSDYEDIYKVAADLLEAGEQFRKCRLQMLDSNESDLCTRVPWTDLTDPTEPIALLKSYYDDFNNGTLLNDFCPQFAVDERGYCTDDSSIRNQLLKARRSFVHLYLVENESMTFEIDQDSGPEVVNIQEVGLAGMLEATRELAYAHMIFGGEYAIDAFDYAYTLKGQAGYEVCRNRYFDDEGATGRWTPNQDFYSEKYFESAECVIEHELFLLNKAREQYQFAIDIMMSAYHEDISWPRDVIIGELFTQAEIQTFAAAIESYSGIIDEIAIRNRQLGDDEAALVLYNQAHDNLFLLTLPLLKRAKELHQDIENEDTKLLLESNGLAVRSGVELLQTRIQEIENGINVFGFNEDMVPIQSYAHMRDTATALLDWAEVANNDAVEANRTFEINKDVLNLEMLSLQSSHKRQLQDLCGAPEEVADSSPENDYEVCIGSQGTLMEKSWFNFAAAMIDISLAELRIDVALEEIADIQSKNDEIIRIKSAAAKETAALTLAAGMAKAVQTTQSASTTTATDIYSDESTTKQKVEKPGLFSDVLPIPNAKTTKILELGEGFGGMIGAAAAGAILGPAGAPAGKLIGDLFIDKSSLTLGRTDRTTTDSNIDGIRHSETSIQTINTITNTSEITIAQISALQQMVTLAEEVEISGIETKYEITQRLRQIAQLQIQKKLAINRFNQAVSDHERLKNEWHYLRALYRRSLKNLQSNYLANPAYRLLRDHKTEIANYQLNYAARQAYLTAKALEYHLADTVPNLEDVFKVRHVSQLHAYLERLQGIYNGTPLPDDALIEFSLREIATGIRNQDINNLEGAEKLQLSERRQDLFIEYLDKHLVRDEQGNPEKLILVFDTSLNSGPLAVPNRYNWRIAGAVTGTVDESNSVRCPVRKSFGVAVHIDQGAQTLPDSMYAVLTSTGSASTRTRGGSMVHYSPQLVTHLHREDLPSSIIADLYDATADATMTVSTKETIDTYENTVSDFCNMSVASTGWTLEIPIKDFVKDYTIFNDIRIRMWTFHYD
ncbi:MAG: hypothetical protein AAF702_22315 [Chloroflexota bacterium]